MLTAAYTISVAFNFPRGGFKADGGPRPNHPCGNRWLGLEKGFPDRGIGSTGALIRDTLVGRSCETLLDTLVGHSCGTLSRDTLVGHCCGTLL